MYVKILKFKTSPTATPRHLILNIFEREKNGTQLGGFTSIQSKKAVFHSSDSWKQWTKEFYRLEMVQVCVMNVFTVGAKMKL